MKSPVNNKVIRAYKPFLIVFLVITIITITSRVLNMDEVENIFKPLLMPILMIFIYVNTNKLSSLFSKLIFLALLFSMFGDVFLISYLD